MKTSTWVWIVIIIIVLAAGGWYWYSTQQGTMMPAYGTSTTTPSANAGTNGSANQGNLGQPDNGQPQQPQGDGTGVSENLILGITTGSGDVANFLSAYNGMTLYTYLPDSDTPGKSSCTSTCAQNWPPYSVQSTSDIHVPANIYGQVSTITRADGTLQVTYNGKPLYFYAGDKAPGEAKGEGLGNVWYVAKP